MQNGSVRVSVLIPVFNRRALIAQAVSSALLQDVDGMEVVVIDNCSTDGTWELLQEIRDPRLRCLRNETNVGLFGNFNRCGEQARGTYALFLCSDDRLEPGFVASAVRKMEAHPSAVLLSSRGRTVDAAGRTLGRIATRFPAGNYTGRSVPAAWFWANYYYGGNPLNYPSGVLFRTDALRACLPFRGELGAPADIDMYLRVLAHGDLLVSDETGCVVMQHSEQEADRLRRSGELTRQDLNLLDTFRRELEAEGAYEKIRRQTAYHVLTTLVRVAKVDVRGAIELFRTFGRAPADMIAAGIRLKSLRAAERLFGWRRLRYLQPAAHAIGSHADTTGS